ncbi:cyclodeaminase [Acidihalobacter ferrooxydans]|uniref:Cyclodeaminase n=1 Tax=Acidihalobacter ferrooxydans TaxID=1765967 RepID=A0A1P8UG38_9GAMM|nr:cyclodeaminase [Acidihalobacter ferrooxydans]APZ42775.1 cyclodeaminase [Acidihalobacter ferrooxydans]
MNVRILTERELRHLVPLDLAAIDAAERAFRALGEGRAIQPPVLALEIAPRNAEVDIKTAYIDGIPQLAIKASSGFFDNPARGLPSLSGFMAVLSAETGRVEAVLLDNGYLTDLRTAAAGALAARTLARTDARSAGVLGTGLQARLQIEALKRVRPLEKVLVWGRRADAAQAYAAEMTQCLGIPVETRDSAAAVVREADIVVTTTPSREPIVQADWLHAGQHVTAMGSDAPYKNEIAPAALARATRIVCDRIAQSLTLGELRPAIAAGCLSSPPPTVELGAILCGNATGRTSDRDITLCDLTGTGAQDTAIAAHALALANAAGLGQEIDA